LIGSMPQDTLHVYDSTNDLAIANDPIQSPYAQFAAAAGDPTTVTAGQPFDFTIIAQDNTGATLATYNNQVRWYAYNSETRDFSGSNYESFIPADQGQHIFHNLVLPVAGTYTLGFDDGWNVSSFTLDVVASGGGHLGASASGNSMAAGDGPATSAVPFTAVTSAAGSTPPAEVFTATCPLGGDLVVDASNPVNRPRNGVQTKGRSDAESSSGHSTVDPVRHADKTSDSVTLASAQATLIPHASARTAVAGRLPKSLSSSDFGSAIVVPPDDHSVVKSSVAENRSRTSLVPPATSVRTAALDECFELYAHRAYSRASHNGSGATLAQRDFNTDVDFLPISSAQPTPRRRQTP
jgi:hypothetical protein